MNDEERAQWLDLALNQTADAVDMPDDAELADLLQLAATLQKLGPNIALISQADASFDAAFERRLKNTLLAEHPAQDQRVPAAAHRHEAADLPARWWRRFRALIALALVALAVIVVVLVNALRSTPPGAQVAVGAPTATGIVPQPFAAVKHAAGQAQQGSAPAPRPTQQQPAKGMAPMVGVPPAPMHSQALRPSASPSAPSGTPAPLQAEAIAPRPTPSAAKATPLQRQQRIALAPAAPPTPRPTATAISQIRLPGAPVTGAERVTTYVLPSTITLPAQVHLYALRYQPMTDQALHKLVATFRGLHAVAGGVPGTGVRTYTGAGDRLDVDPSTGEVTYTSAAPRSGPVSPRARPALVTAALIWLRQHRLYPANVASGAVAVTFFSTYAQVSFAPSTRLTLVPGTPQLFVLQVQLNAHSQVLSAHLRWPRITQGAPVRLNPISSAIRRHSKGAHIVSGGTAAGGGNLHVHSVQVAYEIVPSATFDRLVPVYVLAGTLAEPGGHLLPFSQILPAEATG
jgi:hypothetical protein